MDSGSAATRKPKQDKQNVIFLRLTPEAKQVILEAADKELMTDNRYCIRAILEYLEAHQRITAAFHQELLRGIIDAENRRAKSSSHS